MFFVGGLAPFAGASFIESAGCGVSCPLILTLTFVVSALCSRNRCFAHRHRFLDRGTSFFFVRTWVLTNRKTQTKQTVRQAAEAGEWLTPPSTSPTSAISFSPFPFFPRSARRDLDVQARPYRRDDRIPRYDRYDLHLGVFAQQRNSMYQ
jgi:hypothetical protein